MKLWFVNESGSYDDIAEQLELFDVDADSPDEYPTDDELQDAVQQLEHPHVELSTAVDVQLRTNDNFFRFKDYRFDR